MSHRRRPLAVLAIVVSLFLAGAPVTTALPHGDPTAAPVGERLLAWVGNLGDVLARVFDAAETPPSTVSDPAVPVSDADPQMTLQMSPAESEAGPVVDPDG